MVYVKRRYMTKDERLKIYDEATKLWGLVAQYDQCIEEMAELTVAINTYKRKVLYGEYEGKDIAQSVVEEIADVKLCLEQIEYFFKDYDIDKVVEKKVQKLEDEIEYMKSKKK